MPKYIIILLHFVFIACETSTIKNNNLITNSKKTDTTNKTNNLDLVTLNKGLVVEDTTDYDNATYFIIIADTNIDYFTLHKKMFFLNRQLNITIDTMGRFFNKTKNLIALPDNDEDEIYAGYYSPRRFPSNHLSLEYLNFYQNNAPEKTIALVAGIYETEKSADSMLTILQKIEKEAFKVKAEIYVGCIH